MEELARPDRLGDAVGEVQSGHLLVADLGVHAVQFRALQTLDEGQGVADGREQDVATRLVRLGLDGEPEAVALVDDVLAEQVERLLHPVQRDPHVLRSAGLRTLPAAPGHIRLGTQFDREVDIADHLAQREPAHVTVVGRETAVLEDRVREQVRRRHRDLETGRVQRLTEPLHDAFALGVRRAERDQVVVVEGHTVGTELRELLDGVDRVDRRAGRVAERVAPLPAHGPQAEGELVLRGGGEAFGHGPSAFGAMGPQPVGQPNLYLFTVMINHARTIPAT